MASPPSNPSPSSTLPSHLLGARTAKSIETLRQQAQTHLVEIETEKSLEHLDRLTRDAEVQKYMKQPRKSRSKAAPSSSSSHHLKSSPSPPPSSTAADNLKPKPKLRPASDILSRLQHDPTLNISEYVIGYVERFDGIAEMPVVNWVRESTDEDFIPMHRIRWIKRRRGEEGEEEEEEVVWDRDGRVDRVFGSGGGLEGE